MDEKLWHSKEGIKERLERYGVVTETNEVRMKGI